MASGHGRAVPIFVITASASGRKRTPHREGVGLHGIQALVVARYGQSSRVITMVVAWERREYERRPTFPMYKAHPLAASTGQGMSASFSLCVSRRVVTRLLGRDNIVAGIDLGELELCFYQSRRRMQ